MTNEQQALFEALDVAQKVLLRMEWLCSQLVHGNDFSETVLWQWLREAEAARGSVVKLQAQLIASK